MAQETVETSEDVVQRALVETTAASGVPLILDDEDVLRSVALMLSRG